MGFFFKMGVKWVLWDKHVDDHPSLFWRDDTSALRDVPQLKDAVF